MVRLRRLAGYTLAAGWLLAAGCGQKHEEVPPPVASAAEAGAAPEADDAAGDPASAENPSDEFEFEDEPRTNEARPLALVEVDGALKTSLAAKQQTLEEESLRLAQQRAEFEATQAEFTKRLDEVRSLEKRLDERLGVGEKARQRREQRIAALAKLLLNMQPQSAADMVTKMPDQDAQELLLIMAHENERKASKLLSAMPGERAAVLGRLYIERDPKTLLTKPQAAPMAAATRPLPAPDDLAARENTP